MKFTTTGLLVFSVLMIGIVHGHSGATGIVKEEVNGAPRDGFKVPPYKKPSLLDKLLK